MPGEPYRMTVWALLLGNLQWEWCSRVSDVFRLAV